MQHNIQNLKKNEPIRQIYTPIKTTLYDLVEAVSGTVNPENNQLVSKIVLDLLNTGWSNVRIQ